MFSVGLCLTVLVIFLLNNDVTKAVCHSFTTFYSRLNVEIRWWESGTVDWLDVQEPWVRCDLDLLTYWGLSKKACSRYPMVVPIQKDILSNLGVRRTWALYVGHHFDKCVFNHSVWIIRHLWWRFNIYIYKKKNLHLCCYGQGVRWWHQPAY